MQNNGVPGGQLKRVEPFQGLMIDDAIWRDAHNYHRRHQQLHTLLLHGWGVVRGLEVTPNVKPDRTLVIHPGVAVDPEGRMIMVSQPIRYRLNAEEAGVIYLLLTFRDIPTEPVTSPFDGSKRNSRVLEGYSVTEYDHLPDTPFVELARLQLTAGTNPVASATIPADPAANEIDLRFRVDADLRPGPLAIIGAWSAGAGKTGPAHERHTTGASYLVRELGIGTWQLRWQEIAAGANDPLGCDLLLMPLDGRPQISEQDRARLNAFLDEGGVLLAEPCSGEGNEDNRTAMLLELAGQLKRDPAPVDNEHPLLTSHHVFGAAPQGAANGMLLDANGLLLSMMDYGCAWRGGLPGRALERERIRSATEFGENIVAYALERRRMWRMQR